jgi:hypothetical protein
MAQSPYRTTQFPQPGAPRPEGSNTLATVSKVVLGLGCGCGSLIALSFFLFFVWLASLPESGAVPGGQMRAESLDYLEEQGLLEAGERVVYYYDYTLRMTDEEACFFTERRVVYHRAGAVNEIPWDDVESIDAWEDWGQIIEVGSRDGRYLRCEIPALNGGEAFYAAMLDSWDRFGEGG